MNKHTIKGTFVESGLQYTQASYEDVKQLDKHSEVLWTWKGDKASSELIIISQAEAVDDITLKVSKFVSEASTLPAEAVQVHFMKEVKGFIGHAGWYAYNKKGIMPTGPKESFVDVLSQEPVMSLATHSMLPIWIEIQVPEQAEAGFYKGSVEVESSQGTITFYYLLEVLDITALQPHEYLFDVEYWHHPYNIAEYYGVEPFSKAHLEKLKAHMNVYKTLGGHAITASIVEEAWGGQTYSKHDIHYPSMIKWIKKEDGTWVFDYTHFDLWIELNHSLGIGDEVVCYSMMPWDNQIIYTDEALHKQQVLTACIDDPCHYRSVWIPFLTSFVDHLEEKGWFDVICMGYDERHGMQVALDLVDEVKNSQGKSLKKVAAFNDFEGNKAVLDRLNAASVGLQEIRNNVVGYKEEVEKRRAEGKKTTLYTATEHFPNSFVKSMPVESYWTIMYAGALGTDGYLRWAFDAWVENPLEDTTHASFQAGDCFLIYPECQWSVRLAKLDEGVRDINKLYYIAKKCPQMQGRIAQLLEQVKSQYAYEEVETPSTWAVAGRSAKWALPSTKVEMAEDMKQIKEGIKSISHAYIKSTSTL